MEHFTKNPKGLYYIDRRINGERCHLTAKTEPALREKKAKWIAEQNARQSGRDASTRFELVAREWWDDAQQKLKVGTWRCYSPCVDRCVNYFGGQIMADIAPEDIAVFFGKLKSQLLARNTISNTKTVLNQIFNFWLFSDKYEGKKQNPVTLYRLPRGLPKADRDPPTPEQIAAVKNNPQGFGVAAWVFMYTGARLGEALALQWRDIDFINNTITISKSVTYRGNNGTITTTKTKNGVRNVPLLAPLKELLTPLQGAPNDYVLSGCDTFLSRNMYREKWAAYCHQIGQATQQEITDKNGGHVRYTYSPNMTAHQFRHEYASTLYYAGLGELETMRILGHSDISITRNIYQHLREKQLQDATDRLNGYIATQTN